MLAAIMPFFKLQMLMGMFRGGRGGGFGGGIGRMLSMMMNLAMLPFMFKAIGSLGV